MNWVLYALSGLNIFYGLLYVSQTGKVVTAKVTPQKAATYMFASIAGAVIMFVAAWRLT